MNATGDEAKTCRCYSRSCCRPPEAAVSGTNAA